MEIIATHEGIIRTRNGKRVCKAYIQLHPKINMWQRNDGISFYNVYGNEIVGNTYTGYYLDLDTIKETINGF